MPPIVSSSGGAAVWISLYGLARALGASPAQAKLAAARVWGHIASLPVHELGPDQVSAMMERVVEEING